jgi:hypothetical protein
LMAFRSFPLSSPNLLLIARKMMEKFFRQYRKLLEAEGKIGENFQIVIDTFISQIQLNHIQ